MSYQKWFVDERANGSCFSIAQMIQTKGNHLSTRFVAHISDGLPRNVAELIASAPRLEYENNLMKEEIKTLQTKLNLLENNTPTANTATPTDRYTKKLIPKNDTDIFTIEEWEEEIQNGNFCNYDGSGYWVKNNLKSNDEVFSTPKLDATHVIWYNK